MSYKKCKGGFRRDYGTAIRRPCCAWRFRILRVNSNDLLLEALVEPLLDFLLVDPLVEPLVEPLLDLLLDLRLTLLLGVVVILLFVLTLLDGLFVISLAETAS